MYGDQECTAAAAKSASAREAGDSETATVAPAAAAFDLSARGKLCCSLHDAMWASRLLGFISMGHFPDSFPGSAVNPIVFMSHMHALRLFCRAALGNWESILPKPVLQSTGVGSLHTCMSSKPS